ncbi:unnamed protein product, partial [Polarella glacialis]
AFFGLHRAEVLTEKRYQRLRIGRLAGSPQAVAPSVAPPYGEAMGFWRVHSPYYTELHHSFRDSLRGFIDREIRPEAAKMDEEGAEIPLELNRKMGDAGILAAAVATHHGMRSLADDLGITLPGGVQFEKYDVFHDLILSEEFKRLGTYGLADGLLGAFSIGFPPVLSFGSPAMIAKVAPALLRGEKRIALAISEPYAGSDVANIRTRGELSADGSSPKHVLWSWFPIFCDLVAYAYRGLGHTGLQQTGTPMSSDSLGINLEEIVLQLSRAQKEHTS